MAQDLYAAARAHTQSIPADQTPEAVLARYKAAHPEDQNATVVSPGQEGYAGPATLDTQAQAYVRDRPLTDSRLKAQVEAERRLTTNGDNAARENALMQGVLLGGADELGGRLAQGSQMIENLRRRAAGEPIEVNSSDLNDAYVDTFRRQQSDFASRKPFQSIGLNVAGGLLTGGATLGAGVTGAAATGAVYGGATGFNSGTGSFAERLPGAALGAAVGGAAGGALQGGLQVAAPYAKRIAGIAGGAINPGGAARAATREMGPAVGAAARLQPLIGPEQFAERARLQGLGLEPSVLDTFGNQGERIVRNAAGPAGPAADLAVQNSVSRTANLKPEIMDVTRGLSSDPRSLEQVREGLDSARSSLATEQYAPAYATRVPVTEDVLSAISDEPGISALRRARQAAVARRDSDQVGEIDSLIQKATATMAARNIDRLPSSEAMNFPDTPTPSQMQEFGRVERVPLNAARRTQNSMDWERFNRGESPGDLIAGYGDKPVAVRREDGEYLIYDGNHRAVRSIRSGGRDMEMYVIDAKDFAPDMAGRPRATVSRSEIDDLLRELGADSAQSSGAQPQGSTVSAGTLDRIRIALGNKADALGRNATGARDVAGGLRGRASDIDRSLETVDELRPARATYADLSGAIENLDDAGSVFNTNPSDFADRVSRMTPTQREAMVIGVRERIMGALGGQREAGTGTLQTVAEAPYSRQNLETLLGPQEAQQYVGQIQERVRQAQRAARVSPNTNSQTFGRTIDDETQSVSGMVGAGVDAAQAATGNLVAIGRTLDRIRSRATLSPEERSAIVQLGIGSADDLERIVQVAEMARRQGRPVPREVRRLAERSRNVLGAQSPVSRQIEQLLLPSRVAAEEEQQ